MNNADFMRVPTLSAEEKETFLQRLEDFEVSTEQKEQLEKHRQAIRNDE